jgi:hypothetical protein
MPRLRSSNQPLTAQGNLRIGATRNLRIALAGRTTRTSAPNPTTGHSDETQCAGPDDWRRAAEPE